MTTFLHIFFELSPWPPGWTALLAGFATIGWDGRLWLTAEGQDYLDGLDRCEEIYIGEFARAA